MPFSIDVIFEDETHSHAEDHLSILIASAAKNLAAEKCKGKSDGSTDTTSSVIGHLSHTDDGESITEGGDFIADYGDSDSEEWRNSWQTFNESGNVRFVSKEQHKKEFNALCVKSESPQRNKPPVSPKSRKRRSNTRRKRRRSNSMTRFLGKTPWEQGLWIHLHETQLYVLRSVIEDATIFDLSNLQNIFRCDPRKGDVFPIVLDFGDEVLQVECVDVDTTNYLYGSLETNWKLLQKLNLFPSSQPLPRVLSSYTPDNCFERCETGDIILYKTKAFQGKFTRTITNRDWDHCAMFVWVQVEGSPILGVLEALSDKGTQLWPWDAYIREKYDSEYSEIVVRHLHIPDKNLRNRIHFQLQYFVQQAINTPYSIIRGFFRRGSKDLDDPKRTFFCSSLVAKAYKTVGLLQGNIASRRYYPGHFHQNEGIAILHGSSLSAPVKIDFESFRKPPKIDVPAPMSIESTGAEITASRDQDEEIGLQTDESPKYRACVIS